LKENVVRRRQARTIHVALLTLLVSAGYASTSQAETGTVRVVFTKAGLIVGVGAGRGVLTFRGKDYPFKVTGTSYGATIGASTGKLVGKALNLREPVDIAGLYTGLGAGAAVAAGANVVKLKNDNGVVLQLAGPKMGVELSVSLTGARITME
jgi:hypothetical protein